MEKAGLNKMISHQLQKTVLGLFTATLSLIAPCASAMFDTNGLRASLVTGAFYTDQSGISGTVTPWRLVLNYKQNIDKFTELAIRMNSQTGITTGPYVDGFNTQVEYFRIETIQYTRQHSELTTSRFGFGKLKANLLKKGGTRTPMPFSNAMAKLPLNPSDIAYSVQRSATNFNGTYTLGTAVNNISTTTDDTNRDHSIFAEVFRANPSGALWLQYSQNSLVNIFNSNHYFSLGYNTIDPITMLNGTLYLGVDDGFIGFDCGYKKFRIKQLGNSQLGIGYGYSQDKQKTAELSLLNKNNKALETTISWYIQKPKNTTPYNVAGVKLEHKL